MSGVNAGDSRVRCKNCFELTSPGDCCDTCGWDGVVDTGLDGALPPGTILRDDYMVGRALGHGGFGITYLAWDLRLSRKRAIKEYFPRGVVARSTKSLQVSLRSGQGDLYKQGIQKYLEEARLLAEFETHPCIVSPLTFFKLNGTAYLVMEYLQGETFHSYVTRNGGRIPYADALHFLVPVIDALSAIHEKGITHRDVTPENVFLTVDGKTKLIDFGAARQQLASQRGQMTVIVRDRYAPPEQYSLSGRQGPWTDVYAFCATLYFAITGEPPAHATERFESDAIVPPSELGADIPEAAEAALMQGLSLRTSERLGLVDLGRMLTEAGGSDRAIPEVMDSERRAPADPRPPVSRPVSEGQPERLRTLAQPARGERDARFEWAVSASQPEAPDHQSPDGEGESPRAVTSARGGSAAASWGRQRGALGKPAPLPPLRPSAPAEVPRIQSPLISSRSSPRPRVRRRSARLAKILAVVAGSAVLYAVFWSEYLVTQPPSERPQPADSGASREEAPGAGSRRGVQVRTGSPAAAAFGDPVSGATRTSGSSISAVSGAGRLLAEEEAAGESARASVARGPAPRTASSDVGRRGAVPAERRREEPNPSATGLQLDANPGSLDPGSVVAAAEAVRAEQPEAAPVRTRATEQGTPARGSGSVAPSGSLAVAAGRIALGMSANPTRSAEGEVGGETPTLPARPRSPLDPRALVAYARGLEQLEARRVREGLRTLRDSAERGYVPAMMRLARTYADKALGVFDDREAIRWYERAGTAGDAEAQYRLGLRYEIAEWLPPERGVAPNPFQIQDRWTLSLQQLDDLQGQIENRPIVASRSQLDQARRWYDRAAEQGDVRAQQRLALLYWDERGLPENRAEAFRLLLAAAEAGDPGSQLLVGYCFARGHGAAPDGPMARFWIERAAAGGIPLAQNVLEDLARDDEMEALWERRLERRRKIMR